MRIAIEKLVAGGSGLGEVDGKRIFVPYAAPGDVLEIEVDVDHGAWAEGAIARIEAPASCRAAPRCPVFGLCGGCQWQHLAYAAQLEGKRAILREAIERIGKIEGPDVLETLPSPREWHYRNRIQLHVDSKGRVGFYRRRSKEVVEFEACAIADERLNAELKARRGEIASRDRGIALRVEEGDGSFSQINTAQNERLQGIVAEWLSAVPHGRVLELYAGSGNFTFAIAKIAGCVLASDVDQRSIDAARGRQIRENACNVEFICAPAAAAAAKAIRRLGGGVDAVIVDPPRKGCAEAVGAIAVLGPQAILSISCDPATLARDLQAFAAHGYRLVRALPVDMFPQTFHIESLSLLERTIPPKGQAF